MRNTIVHLSKSSKMVIGTLVMVCGLFNLPPIVEGAQKFDATVIDTNGDKSHMKNFRFYYEEQLNDTPFVSHELRYMPVKKGASTIQVQFANIKKIHISSNGKEPELTIHLHNGKTGKFPLGIAGSFRGESDFGEMDMPSSGITSIILKK
ncbi:MAG: hypothetical protein NPIRA02_13450 [Nitrospirales bacterium]|nr:MAG: hypothetical protein NPIRA02_13450 [Nitrospirales bacterium]